VFERPFKGVGTSRRTAAVAAARGRAYAPYCDLVWCETSTPDLGEARGFGDVVHEGFPGKPLAYNCSPSFKWRRNLDDAQIATFQKMSAYVRLQDRGSSLAAGGYSAVKHQREVGTGWFDLVPRTVSQGASSTLALRGSTESERF
jgi:isocitrate/methylisocitrate lyase